MKFTTSTLWILVVAALIFTQLFCIEQIEPYVVQVIVYSGINIILAVSLNLINGFTGQFSMGHAGFMAVGAYAGASLGIFLNSMFPELMSHYLWGNLIFSAVLIISGLAAGLAGFIVGQPSLRLKGDYLAVVTLGFGEIIRVIILNLDSLGAARGLTGIPPLTNFLWVYLTASLTIFYISRLINAPVGRRLLSVREDEIAAETIGVDTTKSKVTAFVTGAFFAGVAGCLFAHYLRFISPQVFDISKSFELIIMVVLGGMGSISGSVFAAIFLTAIKEVLRPLQEFTGTDYRMVIYSLTLILLMLTRPKGIFGTKEFFDYLPMKIRKFFNS